MTQVQIKRTSSFHLAPQLASTTSSLIIFALPCDPGVPYQVLRMSVPPVTMASCKQSTTDTLVNRSLNPPLLSQTTDQSPGYYTRRQIGDADKILAIDLRKHYCDADKLYAIAKDLQQLGIELRTEVVRLNTKANLTKTQSKASSRRDTDDSQNSDYSLKKGLKDTSIGIAIMYDPSDFRLAVRSMEAMKGIRPMQPHFNTTK